MSGATVVGQMGERHESRAATTALLVGTAVASAAAVGLFFAGLFALCVWNSARPWIGKPESRHWPNTPAQGFAAFALSVAVVYGSIAGLGYAALLVFNR